MGKNKKKIQQQTARRTEEQEWARAAVVKAGIDRTKFRDVGIDITAVERWAKEGPRPDRRTNFVNAYPHAAPLALGLVKTGLRDKLFLQKLLDHPEKDLYGEIKRVWPFMGGSKRKVRRTLARKDFNGWFKIEVDKVEKEMERREELLRAASRKELLEVVSRHVTLPEQVPLNKRKDEKVKIIASPVMASDLRTFRNIAMTLGAHPEFIDDTPISMARDVSRGAYDIRTLTTPGLNTDLLPFDGYAKHTFLALLDVYAFFHNRYKGLLGLSANIAAFQRAVMGDQPFQGYDKNHVKILFWALRQHVSPMLIQAYEPWLNLQPSEPPERMWKELQMYDAFDQIVADRLIKRADLIALCLETQDLAAFAHNVRACIDDPVTALEAFKLYLLIEGEDEADGTMLSLREMFDTLNKETTDEELQELIGEKLLPHIQKSFNESAKAKLSYEITEELKAELQALEPAPWLREVNRKLGYIVEPKVRRHDHIVHATNLITREDAAKATDGLYKSFGREMRDADAAGAKLARLLKIPVSQDWHFDQDDGFLDPARLTRLITDPFGAVSYRRIEESPLPTYDTSVTILIDCSGSMSSDHKIQMAVIAGERLTKWISSVGIPTSLLGFTTHNPHLFKGPPEGRYEPVRHIIFKDANEPYNARRTIQSLAAPLSPGVLRNNADGEGIAWAHDVAMQSPQSRKLLIVILDGQPAFGYAGSSKMQNKHCKAVVKWIEENSPVDVIGVGIDTPVDLYFSKSIQIKNPADLIHALAQPLIHLVDPMSGTLRRAQRRTQTSGVNWRGKYVKT